MYDELLKALRCCAVNDCVECGYSRRDILHGKYCVDKLIPLAADAIEELKLIAESNERSAARWAETAEAAVEQIPCWIPVTERLPEQKINQNTLDFEYVLCVTTFGDVRPYKFGRRIGQSEPHFWNGAGYVDTYVTHWMPLPEPPNEAEK